MTYLICRRSEASAFRSISPITHLKVLLRPSAAALEPLAADKKLAFKVEVATDTRRVMATGDA